MVASRADSAVGANPTAVLAQQTVTTKAPRYGATPTPAQKQAAACPKGCRLALAKRRAAALKQRSLAKPDASSLSLPTLALYAIIPFLLIGIFLLVSDYLRRRVPRKRNASLVITRVSDR